MRARPAISAVSAGTESTATPWRASARENSAIRPRSPMAATRSGLAKRENAPLISSPVRSPEIYGPSCSLGSRPVAAAENEMQEPNPPPGQAAVALGGVEAAIEAGRVLRFRRRPADHRVVAQEF